MGYASYNRGSKVISNQIDAEKRNYLFDVMDSLNSTKKIETARERFGIKVNFPQPFKTGKISFGNNGWWFEDASKIGGFGYHYNTVREVLANWDIMIVSIDMLNKINDMPVYYTENI